VALTSRRGRPRLPSRSIVLGGKRLCYAADVQSLAAICRLLALLAVVSLLAGAIVRPAMAMPSQQAAMGEMPCCPDETPKSDCAKDCPLMALCAASIQFLPTAPELSIPVMPAHTLLGASTAERSGLAQRPPPKPPKA
jgi:hypothetical protein